MNKVWKLCSRSMSSTRTQSQGHNFKPQSVWMRLTRMSRSVAASTRKRWKWPVLQEICQRVIITMQQSHLCATASPKQPTKWCSLGCITAAYQSVCISQNKKFISASSKWLASLKSTEFSLASCLALSAENPILLMKCPSSIGVSPLPLSVWSQRSHKDWRLPRWHKYTNTFSVNKLYIIQIGARVESADTGEQLSYII